MSFQAMSWAVKQPLPAMQKIVLLMLADRASSDTNECYPSIKKLAFDCGMADRSVIRQVEKLEKANLLRVIRTFNDNDEKNVNRYILLTDRESLGSDRKSLGSDRKSLGSDRKSLQGSDRESLGVVTESHINLSDEPINIEPINEPVDKSKKTVDNPVIELLADYGITGDLASDFIQHRKLKKAVINRTVLNEAIIEGQKLGWDLPTVIKQWVLSGYQGFKAEWFINKNSSGGNHAASSNAGTQQLSKADRQNAAIKRALEREEWERQQRGDFTGG